jgi:integrase
MGSEYGREYAELKDPKNSLGAERLLTEKGVKSEQTTGESLQGKQTVKEKLLAYSWHLQKQNAASSTIQTFTCILRKLVANGADLEYPESVKEAIARIKASPNSKVLTVAAYTSFLRFQNRSRIPPKYKHQDKIPFIPGEQEINDLISGCSRTISATLLLLKESGMRIGEACRLKWTDVNAENSTISVNEPEKGSCSRIFKASSRLISVLQALPKRCDLVLGKSNARQKAAEFQRQRLGLSVKLANPRLKQITFHTLRHWKATMAYHETRDLIYVKQLLGHKQVQNTMKYINIEQAIFSESDDKFHVRATTALEEACGLIEAGYEYVTDMNGTKLFRKRK